MSERSRLAVVGLWISLLLGACNQQDRLPAPPAGPERFARMVHAAGSWIPESEVPRIPQASPGVVAWELNADSTLIPPSSAQREAADAFEARCEAAAREHDWFDFEAATAEGYELLFNDTRHYMNREYVIDGRILDCDRPESLMYYETPAGKLLAGLMFLVNDPSERGPQFGGSATLWHYHIWSKPYCMLHGLMMVGRPDEGRCREGEPRYRSPEMIHLWLLRHPQGRFGTKMSLSREDLDAAIAERGEP